ncbi:hypothetical protein CVV38_02540 [Candidatus Peregrinibacteria bacterium HGW-Peregrinibacteria-1]|jgi:2'-5' RNA ligase|nr:MAG: hypothetical protein CVV38_02540 [Candidatus Peregrinibacteria bacterium HGW-Peregrinibacteria-1]
MRIGFAILLDDESHNFARQVELELCEKFGLCWGLRQSPHITIKTPFDTPDLRPIVNYLEELSTEISPFSIELEGFNSFEPKVLFIDVKDNPALQNLHLRILKDLQEKFQITPSQFEGPNMKFHSSIALEDTTEDKFQEAQAYLSQKKPYFKFKADTIGIFYHLGDAGWAIIRRINLNQTT